MLIECSFVNTTTRIVFRSLRSELSALLREFLFISYALSFSPDS